MTYLNTEVMVMAWLLNGLEVYIIKHDTEQYAETNTFYEANSLPRLLLETLMVVLANYLKQYIST